MSLINDFKALEKEFNNRTADYDNTRLRNEVDKLRQFVIHIGEWMHRETPQELVEQWKSIVYDDLTDK